MSEKNYAQLHSNSETVIISAQAVHYLSICRNFVAELLSKNAAMVSVVELKLEDLSVNKQVVRHQMRYQYQMTKPQLKK